MATRTPIPPDAGADTYASAAGGPPAANPYAAASAQHKAAPHKSKGARFLRMAAALLALLVLAVVLAGVGVWVWSGRSTSLATTVAQAARYLPADQTLETRDVTGSLRGGGTIGWLRWSNPTMAVEVDSARIGWSLAPLLQRSVKLGEVHADRVRIASTPDPDAPRPEPLQELVLPVSIDLPFQIDLIEWAGPPPVEARALSGRYRYDRVQHSLKVDGVDLAQGHYRLDATLQALAPMALQAQLDGQVRTETPGSDQPLELSAHATVNGTLATEAARLQVLAQLRPPGTDTGTVIGNGTGTGTANGALGEQGRAQAVAEAVAGQAAARTSAKTAKAAKPAQPADSGNAPAELPANTMQADVQASVAPWAAQPLLQASADLRALNLAALWPQAPTTALQGSVQAGPQGQGWQLAAQLQNSAAGPWDQGQLPVSGLDAQADYDGEQWRIPQAEVRVGNGRITAQGAYTVASGAVEGSAQVQALNPAALHTQLDAAPVNGQLSAQMDGGAVRFNADLRASGRAAPVRTAKAGKAGKTGKTTSAPLRIESVRANGLWNAPLLTLQQLDVDALQAQLRGQKIEVTLDDALAVSGNVALTVPGATASTQSQLGQADGNGELKLNIASAERVQDWLQSLPGMGTALQGTDLQGQARLDARWRGGLRSLQQQLQSAGGGTGAAAPKPVRGDTPFTLQATLTAPRMDIALPPPKDSVAATRIQLSRVNAELSGSLAQARLSLDGQAQLGERRAALSTQASGGLASGGAAAQWRATVAALQLQLQDPAYPGTWAVKLQRPLDLTVRLPAQGQAGSTVVQTGAGQARISGPVPGTVAVDWQPLRMVQSPAGAVQLQSKGELTGLPMAWADAFTAPGQDSPLAAIGMSGNLVFNGRWDVDAGESLRASAVLERASGDLRLLTGEAATVTTVRSSGSQPKAASTSSASAPVSGTAAGVRQARLELNAEGNQVRARLQWDSERAGQAEANASSTLTPQDSGWTWTPDTPLSARLRARLPDVGVWSALAPPGWRIHGTLDADATLSGTLNDPQWQGTLGADRVTVQSLLDGVDLKDGRLRAVLRGNQLDITELSLQGGQGSQARIAGYSGNLTPPPQNGGSLQGSGTLRWGLEGTGTAAGGNAGAAGNAGNAGNSGIALDFTAQLRSLQVLVRADRQASVSGTLRAGLQDGQITLRGDLTVDRATIILPEASAPKLGDDVVVRSAAIDQANAAKAQKAGKSAARAQTTRVPDIAVTLNLGRDFALQGFGITTRLEGELQVRGSSVASAPPRITGEVRTVQGRYRAWGQALNVETGIARFNGPYNNPSLDILAVRPNIAVRAGVKVTGSAQAPRVRLYSDPVLPDAEILSWVVVGRSTAGGGAEAALLQQAALALLGGQGGGTGSIAERLGVDEIGFKGPSNGNGSKEDAGGAAITLGKRLSSNLYVTYEQSLSGAMGAIYIFYDLTKRLTLRGQTGSQSAVDIIYTVDKD